MTRPQPAWLCLISLFVSTPFALIAQQAPYQNPALAIDQRVDDLVGRMTLEEKVQQMRDHAPAIPRLGVPK